MLFCSASSVECLRVLQCLVFVLHAARLRSATANYSGRLFLDRGLLFLDEIYDNR